MKVIERENESDEKGQTTSADSTTLKVVPRDRQLDKDTHAEVTSRSQQSRRGRLRRLLFTACLCVVAFLAGLAVMSALEAGPGFHAFWVPLLATVAILIGSVIKEHNTEKAAAAKLERMTEIAEEAKDEINAILEENLRPRVITLDSHDKVLRAASEIIGDAIKEPEENRFVIFVGAASLCTDEDKEKEADAENTVSPAADYVSKLTLLDVKRIQVTRYISLFTKEELSQRKQPTKNNYLKWVDKQIGRLNGNPNYVIVDCPRAQPWGGSRSSIITHSAFMDIVGQGDCGFLIKDEEVARTIRERTEKLLEDANRRETYGGGNPEAIKPLQTKYGEARRRR